MKDKSGKKSIIAIGIFIVTIIVILLGGALIYNKFFFKKSFSEVETIMLEAAKEYFDKNEEKLPKNINDSITVNVDTLVKNNEMDTIVSYTKNKDVTCTGSVKVTNINKDVYRYTPILECEDEYQTKIFIDYINENINTVTVGDGLYNLNDELVYRGENVDNYLKLGGKIYRIVKFKDNKTVVILTDRFENMAWDDRYNIDTEDNAGINNYEVSRVREYLDKVYVDTSEEALLTEKAKMLVTSYDLPIGKRNDKDTNKNGSLEISYYLPNQYIGLLPVSDFLNASISKDCLNTVSDSCENYNYLNKYKYTWWTATANAENSYRVYSIKDIPKAVKASSSAYLRPVLYLASDAIYVSGDGTKANPYIVK